MEGQPRSKVFVKPPYIAFVQKPYCCSVTCLQMILYRRGLKLIEQEKMAAFFGITIPAEDRRFFNTKLKIRENNKELGIKTVDSARVVNDFFKKYKYPLTAKGWRSSKISDLKQFITSNIQAGNDLWVEYKSDEIHREHFIHDNLIEGISKKEWITLVDPWGEYKTRTQVTVEVLERAIERNHYGRETGFLVVSDLDTK